MCYKCSLSKTTIITKMAHNGTEANLACLELSGLSLFICCEVICLSAYSPFLCMTYAREYILITMALPLTHARTK